MFNILPILAEVNGSFGNPPQFLAVAKDSIGFEAERRIEGHEKGKRSRTHSFASRDRRHRKDDGSGSLPDQAFFSGRLGTTS